MLTLAGFGGSGPELGYILVKVLEARQHDRDAMLYSKCSPRCHTVSKEISRVDPLGCTGLVCSTGIYHGCCPGDVHSLQQCCNSLRKRNFHRNWKLHVNNCNFSVSTCSDFLIIYTRRKIKNHHYYHCFTQISMFLDVVFGDMNNLSLSSERYQSQPAGQ